jgi:hypothetical protein
MEDFTSRAQQFQNQHQTKNKEGDVTINYTPGSKKQNSQNTGEYVDYEEIKD